LKLPAAPDQPAPAAAPAAQQPEEQAH